MPRQGRRPARLRYADQIPGLVELMAGREPGTPGDLGRLLEAAGFHRVLGYVADAAEQGRLELGADERRRLAGQRLDEMVRGRLLRREATTIVPVLAEACGASPVLIKGPAVADRLYADARLRPFQDLDFVVPAGALHRAVDALVQGFGYRRLTEPWPGYGENHGHHVALGRRAGAASVVVELHWRISSDPCAHLLDHGYLAQSSVGLTVDGGSVPVAGPSAHLLVLACHLLHEGDKRLVWINDLDLAARLASPTEWEAAFGAADELGLAWVLHRALDYARTHLGLDRHRPSTAGPPPPWGPFRANETFRGWIALQVGQLALGHWADEHGYVRSAVRARRLQARRALRRRARR